jgi:hypothetical protein
MLSIEMPAGVGYSTCDEVDAPKSPGVKCYELAKR